MRPDTTAARGENLKPFQAFVFDLDGVLTETSRQHFLAWRELALSLGGDMDEVFNEKLKGISRAGSLDLILRHNGLGGRYGEAERQALMARKNARYLELISAFTPANLAPGAQALLEALKARGLGIGLASASRNAPLLLERLGIAGHFGAVADPVTCRGKPEPDLFLRAAELLGAEPARCVGVEDAAAGIEAIEAAGMFSVGVGLHLERARLRVRGLDELDLDRLLGGARR